MPARGSKFLFIFLLLKAISRGIDAWKYGFVFSTFKMAMLIGSFVAEKLVSTLPFLLYVPTHASSWIKLQPYLQRKSIEARTAHLLNTDNVD